MTSALRSPALVVPLVLSLLAGIGCEEPPKKVPTEDKQNNDCEGDVNLPTQDATSAVDLEASTEVTGVLCPFRDDDGYRVVVPNDGDVLRIHLFMTTYLTQVEPSYIILKDNGTSAAEVTGITARDPARSAGEPVDFVAAHRIDEAGTYIVVVRDVEGDDASFDNANEYTLLVDIIPDPDAQEPNNTPETSTPLAPGSASGIIATSGDKDIYGIDLPSAGQIIDVTVSIADGSGVDHQMTLFGSQLVDGEVNPVLLQNVLLQEGDTPGTLTGRIRKAASDGLEEGRVGEPYYLVVEDAEVGNDDSNQDAQLDPALGTYAVTLAVSADPDPNEGAFGNEAVARPTSVSDGQTLNASLATTADTDVYKVTPPGGTTADTPAVLTVTVTFDGGFDAELGPQLSVDELDPEDNSYAACSDVAPCTNSASRTRVCLPDDGGQCGEVRLQRFIDSTSFSTAYPLRTTHPVYVVLNDFGDDEFQETGGYTITFDVSTDPDPGEHGDDYLIPNLEEAGYANRDELNQQRSASFGRARETATGYPPLCAEGTSADGCLDLVPVANPVGFGFDGFTVSCADPEASDVTVNLTGRLSYEGDRDYFVLSRYPERGYFGLDFDIAMAGTGVELATFVYAGGGLTASTLTAAQTGSCSEQQGGQNACAEDSICVDGRCWTDGPSNAAVPNVNYPGFGPANGDCVTTGGTTGGGIIIEVVDNGLNDFDQDNAYALGVTISCGCPAVCDNGLDFCQNGI